MDGNSEVRRFERTLITNAIVEIRCTRCGFVVGWSSQEHLIPILEDHHRCKTGEFDLVAVSADSLRRSA